MSTSGNRRAWVEVDTGALVRNYRRLERPEGPGLIPMLKADGYGMGAVRVARALADLEPRALGVATLEEGRELREAGVEARVIVFSPCPPLDADAVVRMGLEPAVSSLDALRDFGEAAARVEEETGGGSGSLRVHLEVDTGMGRLGLLASEAEAWLPEASRLLSVHPMELASTFTHFHSAESNLEATEAQVRELKRVLERMRAADLDPGRVHAANSAALLVGLGTELDLARPGIFLYGGLTAPTEGVDGGEVEGPEAVVSVRTRVLDVRDVPAGHTVSYGALHRTRGPARLATLAIGYGDGFRRELSDRGSVLFRGRRAPIRGAVCMDVTVVDVTDIHDVAPGDVATVLGAEGEVEISLAEMADWCGTIPYEILTGLGSRLPRVERRREENDGVHRTEGDFPPGRERDGTKAMERDVG